jgi:DNA-binding YbaB/EbfC family protein
MNRGLMRQAQQLQAKLEKAQEELERTTVEASSGGGAITVVITGGMKVESVKISPEVVDAAEVEMLEDLVLTAVNEAIRKSQEMASSQLGKITGGLKIPGL